MSDALLRQLNGSRPTNFSRWLDGRVTTPRIAWYPSAGEDFRDLLFLSSQYCEAFPLPNGAAEPAVPDLFLHTDYFPWTTSRFLDSLNLHDDGRTSIFIRSSEELQPCDPGLDPEIVHFPEGSAATGRVVFLELDVNSRFLGSFTARVLYVFACNEAFCARYLLPSDAARSHIVHVRYGGGCGGGGSASGRWLKNVVRRLHCEYFIHDKHFYPQSGDERAYKLFPSLQGDEDVGPHQLLRRIPSRQWSDHGDVVWDNLQPGYRTIS
jgi:hypothetical protein